MLLLAQVSSVDAEFTLQTLLWVVTTAILPVIGWAVHLSWTVRKIQSDTSELIHMHKHADDYGFGSQKTNDVIQEVKSVIADNTRAMQALVHYTKWLAERNTGSSPPPPLDDEI